MIQEAFSVVSYKTIHLATPLSINWLTKTRHLLVLIQEQITIEQLDEECEQLETLMEELLEVAAKLSDKYRLEKDIKGNEKLSLEIEQRVFRCAKLYTEST